MCVFIYIFTFVFILMMIWLLLIILTIVIILLISNDSTYDTWVTSLCWLPAHDAPSGR